MNEQQKQSPPPGAIDELALQNVIRKRYCNNWPSTILELTKRVQAVNAQWKQIITKMLYTEGMRISYAKEGDNLVVTVSVGKVHEHHNIPLEEVQRAMPYIEVLVMDYLINSKLLERYL